MHMSKLAVYGKIATEQIFVWSLLVYPLEVAQAQSSATESAASFLKRGDDLYEKGAIDHAIAQYDQAIAQYNQAIKLNPAIANAYNSRGNSRQAKGDLQGAYEDYSKALQINPQLAETYNNQGNIRRIRGDLVWCPCGL